MLKYSIFIPVIAVCATLSGIPSGDAAERPTLKHNTRDPRPDIIPHPLYDSHVEYRRAYNRPTYIGGWIAHKISATSQEAMVWSENLQAGNYAQKHMPPMYKRYYAPKPWEVLPTGPRPDYAKKKSVTRTPAASADTATENPVEESSPIELRDE